MDCHICFQCYIGTRQECVSFQIIFDLFINDLISFLRSKCDMSVFVASE